MESKMPIEDDALTILRRCERPFASPVGKLSSPRLPANWPAKLKAEAYYGVTGELVRAIEPHSEGDPAAILVQYLVAFGNVIGRSAHFRVEADRHYMNLFAVVVGQTAKGRKGTSFGQSIRILASVDEAWSKARITKRTGERGRTDLGGPRRNRRTRLNSRKDWVFDYEKITGDTGEKDKRLLVVEPEFARVLQVDRKGIEYPFGCHP